MPVGAANDTDSELPSPSTPTTELTVTAPGTVTPENELDAAPEPDTLTARIFNESYDVFPERPVMVIGLNDSVTGSGSAPVTAAHVVPPSIEYSYPTMVTMPVGSVKATDSEPLAPFTVLAATLVGAPGVVTPMTSRPLAMLVPPAFTVRNCTAYAVLPWSPVMTSGDAVLLGERVIQVAPSSSEYCTFVAAPVSAGIVNSTSKELAVAPEKPVMDGAVPVVTPEKLVEDPAVESFTARMRSPEYDVPAVRELMMIGDEFSDAVTHDEPPFSEYW